MKRLICLVLTLLLLLLFSACEGGEKPSETSEKAASPDIILAENGTSEYIIIRGELATKEEINVSLRLRAIIEEATGAQVQLKDDFVRTGTQYVPVDKEIVVGATNREESQHAGEGLKAKDYRILQEGTRLAIAFGSPEAGLEAVEAFAADCLFPAEKKAGVANGYMKEKKSEYPMDTIIVGSRDISEYVIVGEPAFTDPLRDKIAELTGITLKTSSVVLKKNPIIRAEQFTDLGPREAAVRMEDGNLSVGTSGAIFSPVEALPTLFKLFESGKIAENTDVKGTIDKEAVKICYFGGSITVGQASSNTSTKSWRAIVGKWFEETFPDVLFIHKAAGRGGEGSFYNSYRARKECDLDTEFPPDIVFIDSALNDGYDGIGEAACKINVESTILQIYKANPKATIFMLYFTDAGRKGTDYTYKKWTREVADHYNIVSLDVGKQIWDLMLQENNGVAPASSTDPKWNVYIADYCHPNDDGHAKYAEFIIDYLTEYFSADDINRYHETHKDIVLPAKTFCDASKLKLNGDFISFTDAGFKDAVPAGWRMDENGYLRPETPGAKLTMEFTGTAIGFRQRGFKNSSLLSYTITSKTKPDVKFTGSVNTEKKDQPDGGLWPVELTTGLPLDTYTVEISFPTVKEENQNELRTIFIDGDVSTVHPVK